MIIMQPLQVANALGSGTTTPYSGYDAQINSAHNQNPPVAFESTDNADSIFCKLGVAAPYYAHRHSLHIPPSFADSVKSFLIGAIGNNEVVDWILTGLTIATNVILVANAISDFFTAGSTYIVRLALLGVTYTATIFAMTGCPPAVYDNQKFAIQFPTSQIQDKVVTVSGNPSYLTQSTTIDQCRTSFDIELDRLTSGVEFTKTAWGTLDIYPDSIYPPSYSTILDRTLVYENNFNTASSEVQNIPNSLLKRVFFGIGTHQIEYSIHQKIAVLPGSATPSGQKIIVKELVPPTVDSQSPITLEAIEPGGIPVPVGLFNKIKNNLTLFEDDCTPPEKLELRFSLPNSINGDFIPFGSHQLQVWAVDESGNSSPILNQELIVQDTIPPDIFPQHNIGVTVPGGTAQIDSTLVPLEEPLSFDFGTLNPEVTCTVDNSLGNDVSCDIALFPLGTSTVTWTFTDFSENFATEQILVIVKEEGTNTPPVANPTTINVVPDFPSDIQISGSDEDFDPLVFSIVDEPQDGFLLTDIEAIFQTKFSSNGDIPNFAQPNLTCKNIDDTRFVIFSDPDNSRLSIGGDFDFISARTIVRDSSGNLFNPDAFAPNSGAKNGLWKLGSTCNGDKGDLNGVMTDWDRNEILLTIGGAPVPINTTLVEPQSMEHIGGFNGDAFAAPEDKKGLYITDLKNGGRIVQLGYDGNLLNEWDLSTLGVTPDGISFIEGFGDFEVKFVVTDWPNKRLFFVKLLENGQIDLTPQSDSTNDLWDVSQGTVVTSSSPLLGGNDARSMFGAVLGSVEPTNVIFADAAPPGGDFVEWQTPSPVTLRSFALFAHGDTFPGNREISEFRLYAYNYNLDESQEEIGFELIIEEIANPVSHPFFANVEPVESDKFRAEFIRINGGPRVLELDGFDSDVGFVDWSPAFDNPTLPNPLLSPRDIIYDATGGQGILIAEDTYKEVIRCSPATNALQCIQNINRDRVGAIFVDIQELEADGNGHFYVNDYRDPASVRVFDLSGTLVNEIFPSAIAPGGNIFSMLPDSLGNIYHMSNPSGDPDGSEIFKTSSTGEDLGNLSRFALGSNDLGTDYAIDENGVLHILGNSFFDSEGIWKIKKFENSCLTQPCDPGDTFTGFNELGEVIISLTPFGGFAFDSQYNYLFVSDGKIIKTDQNGSLISEFDLPNDDLFTNAGKIIVDEDDSIYMVDVYFGELGLEDDHPRIQKFSSAGDLLGTAIADGILEDYTSFLDKGDFVSVSDIAAAEGLFFVAEGIKIIDDVELGKRLHVFETNPLTPIASGVMEATYTPDANFTGTDQFTFKVNDLFDESNNATVTLNVQQDTTPPTLEIFENGQKFFDDLFPVSMPYYDNQDVYTSEHFLKPMAYQIVKRYAEIYEQNTGNTIPERIFDTLQQTALKIAKLDTIAISDLSENVTFDHKDSDLPFTADSNSYLISDTGKLTTLDGKPIHNLPSQFNLALYPYDGDYQEGLVMIPSKISGAPESCFPSVTMQAESVWGIPKTNPVLDAVFNLIVATDDLDPAPIVTNNAPEFLPLGENVITFTGQDQSGNAGFCIWNVTVEDNVPPNLMAPSQLSTEVSGPLTQVSDLGEPQVNDLIDESIDLINLELSPLTHSTTDLWDVSQGTVVTSSSPLFGGNDAHSMFGAVLGSVEPTNVIFADAAPPEGDFVEWQTPSPVTLRSFVLFAHGDGPGPTSRSISEFRLYAYNYNLDESQEEIGFELIIEEIANPVSHPFSANVEPVESDKFRAEFVRINGGPRVLELDGFSSYFQSCASLNEIITCSLPEIQNSEITISNDSHGEFEVGSTSVTWTAVDFGGNSATSEQQVIITDETSPEFEEHDPIVMIAEDGYSNVLMYTPPNATDLGGLVQEVECYPAPGDEVPIGELIVFCLAVDKALNQSFRAFYVLVDAPDDDGDGISNIVDTLLVPSDDFSDEPLGGITSGQILTRGDQNIVLFDSHKEELGVTIIAEPSSMGINNDFDCQDNQTLEIFRGMPDDLEDQCFDANGNIKEGLTEQIDEDPFDDVDNDLDGIVDEDPATTIGPTPAQVSACNDSAFVSITDGDRLSVSCGSVSFEIYSGPVDIELAGNGGPISTQLDSDESIVFDPQLQTITTGPETSITIIFMGNEIDLSPNETIDLANGSCTVPSSGDMIISENCNLLGNISVPASVIVTNGAVMTINNGAILDIDFLNHNLTVESGSGVLIKSEGRIT